MTNLQIKCPRCGFLTFYSKENKFRPFCSERCKLIDLGQWADETYKIPLKPSEGYQIDPEDYPDHDANLETDLQRKKQE